MKSLIIPPSLQPGDKIHLVSPSSRIDKRFLEGARLKFESWGYKVITGQYADGEYGSYAGTFQQRLDDLQQAMDDPQAKVIFCSRGGYGAIHLIDKLDFTAFARNPKWLVGFSDITALHCLFQSKGFASLHAPMAKHLTVEPENDLCTGLLKQILEGKRPEYQTDSHRLNRKGTATGILRGGNMAVAHGLCGTPYDIPADNTVLFIEDIGEKPHAIERMLYNLKLDGRLARLAGLMVGQFTEYNEPKPPMPTVYESIAALVKEYDYPVCFGFPVGHISRNLPLINGSRVTFSVKDNEVRLYFEGT